MHFHVLILVRYGQWFVLYVSYVIYVSYVAHVLYGTSSYWSSLGIRIVITVREEIAYENEISKKHTKFRLKFLKSILKFRLRFSFSFFKSLNF